MQSKKTNFFKQSQWKQFWDNSYGKSKNFNKINLVGYIELFSFYLKKKDLSMSIINLVLKGVFIILKKQTYYMARDVDYIKKQLLSQNRNKKRFSKNNKTPDK